MQATNSKTSIMIKPKVQRYMKTMNKILTLLIMSLAFFSCSRDFDAPPLSKPHYEGDANITIAELKEKYKEVTRDNPEEIVFDYVIKAKVTANDKSGNIFKNIYIEDETGALTMGLDQNSLYTILGVGQEVFIELHGLYMVSYGGELQVAYKGTTANRIPWEIATKHLFPNDWPTKEVVPAVVTMDQLGDKHVNTLVRIHNVYFQNGGKNTFAPDEGYGEEYIKDAKGNSMLVRSSSFANFAKDLLPEGNGTIQGVLGRFNGNWQLVIRDRDDLIEFGGETPEPEPEPSTDTYYKETFGSVKPAEKNPKIADYKDWDDQTVKYSDPTGNADVRNVSFLSAYQNHVWLAANKESSLVIEGINTEGGKDVVLSYDVAANLYNEGESTDLSALYVVIDGKERKIESKPVSKENGDDGKFYTITLDKVPAKKDLKVEFKVDVAKMKQGLRLDNLVIQEKDDTITITPEKPGEIDPDPENPGEVDPDPEPTPTGTIFYEGFTKLKASTPGTQVKDFASEYKQYADGAASPIEYEISYQTGTLRSTGKIDGHIWFGAGHTNWFKLKNIDTSGGKKLVLSFALAANGAQDLSVIKVKLNGDERSLPSTPALDSNAFTTFTLDNVPAVKSLEIEFSVEGEDNKAGIRLDDIAIAVTE